MNNTPEKKMISAIIFRKATVDAFNRVYSKIRLNIPHKTFVVGDENTLPRGFEKTVGNRFPQTSCTK